MPKREDGVFDVIDITIDRNRISNHFKATVNVTSDLPFIAIEARATHYGAAFGKGIGVCLLSDDSSAAGGVVSLPVAVKQYTFDAESDEIQTDGAYRITVFVQTEDGKWNDGSALYTSSGDKVFDSAGASVFTKRNGSGTDDMYTSAYSGDVINSFISEVLA